MKNLYSILKSDPYPGRGIVTGLSADGKNAVMAYFIMGRSENSRNRIFTEDGNGLKTQAYDISKLSDPSLIIYNPVKTLGDITIVTNGDQTDTIYDFIKSSDSFENALRTREFEPDSPNFTPRISALCDLSDGYKYKLSILKSADEKGSECSRYFYEYQSIAGTGHFIHTYSGEVNNVLLPFKGEPVVVKISDDISEFSNKIWENLNDMNKVSLFVRFINIQTKEQETLIYNANI